MASGPIRKRFQVLHSPGEAEAPSRTAKCQRIKATYFEGCCFDLPIALAILGLVEDLAPESRSG